MAADNNFLVNVTISSQGNMWALDQTQLQTGIQQVLENAVHGLGMIIGSFTITVTKLTNL